MLSLNAAELSFLKEISASRRAEAGKDYDLDKLLPFWMLTAGQDWNLCVNRQRGVNSHACTPGPLSTHQEYNLDRGLRWYLQQMAAAIG